MTDRQPLTLAAIRAAYPNPSQCGPIRTGPYCVGGALCITLGWDNYAFPLFPILSEALEQANPALTRYRAFRYARDIIRLNDDGDFEAAWGKLGEALEWNDT